MSKRAFVLLATLIFFGYVTACSSPDRMLSGSGTASVRVLLTDAPSDYIAAAEVTISSVQLVRDDDDSPFVELMDPDASPATYDLLDLQNGVTELLAQHLVPAGTYNQVRLIVDDAKVTLADGYQFNDGTTEKTLFVPSGMQTGIKVQTNGAIEAEEDMLTVTVIDFDVNKSFVIQGDPLASAGINGVLFTPSLVEVGRSQSGM